jgi:ammonium transporter Rh
VVDIQNATLSGGVAVGAIADLMLGPGGAFFMGTITGVVSAFGYRLLQVKTISLNIIKEYLYQLT